MKQLKDLKDEILSNRINSLYIFYGEDYGLRHHYISKLKESFQEVQFVDKAENIQKASTGIGLFKIKKLYIIHGDEEFAKSKSAVLNLFIKRLHRRYCNICI